MAWETAEPLEAPPRGRWRVTAAPAATAAAVPSRWTLAARSTLRSEALSISAALRWLKASFGALPLSPPCRIVAIRAATIARWLSVRCRRCRFRLTT